ncbi:hypothetical protein JW960_28475 [candidate division KSB1 bacterium]|nr:hypothetical protein [candidate division KSB1 bacterium]
MTDFNDVATETTETKTSRTHISDVSQVSQQAISNEKYSRELCNRLEQIAADDTLLRQYRITRYDTGRRLTYNIEGVYPHFEGTATFEVDKFIGGGFAGQVYRVKLVDIDLTVGDESPLQIGAMYAIKIIVPPSGFSETFRNAIYWLAYQGPFSAQVNYAAARVGVLWQKLIRRGAKVYFGTENAVVDTYATFYDPYMNSYGEVNEWVSGRTWKFEIDDRVFQRKKLGVAERVIRGVQFNSAEYLAKRSFMDKLVKLFHDMGAPELARQYEWGTMKSQPNALLRLDNGKQSPDNLVAIDFRAGLALLPYLPMSPADFKLIIQGLLRGNLVQFDRGNLKKFDQFIEKYTIYFQDMQPVIDELKQREQEYRTSLPDLTHHGLKLLFSSSLRRSVRSGLVDGYQCHELVDDTTAIKLRKSALLFTGFYLLGALPVIGRFLRKLIGNRTYAKHIRKVISSRSYFRKALRAKMAIALINWYRDGRVTQERAESLVNQPARFWTQAFLCGWLPPTWHRFFTDGKYAWDSIKYALTYPIRFYRDAQFREDWLMEQVDGGEKEGMITEQEATSIRESVADPFIQKYLKCVAVHICTLPITQLVSVAVAIYVMIRFGETWQKSIAYGLGVLAAFQVVIISPGSFVRGAYVVYLIIRERNIKDYWVAAMISFWKYIGYLGFPIQMVAKFPALARLMAGRWATSMVHMIPVFGERGALAEHWVFDMFFNIPISIRRWFKKDSK